jgi:hypothetical protein
MQWSPNRNANDCKIHKLGHLCFHSEFLKDVFQWMIGWLFTVLRPAQEYFTHMKTSPLLGAKGLWAGRGLYRVTPAVTRDLGFSGLIRRTAPFSRLLRHTRGCGGSILARILTGYNSVVDFSNVVLRCVRGLEFHQSITFMKCLYFGISKCQLTPISENGYGLESEAFF